MRKKNIAIIIQLLKGGGAERVAANMSIEFEEKYNVYLVVFDASEAVYPYGGTLINLNIPPVKSGSALKHISNIIKRTHALRKFKKNYKIDCSISHMENASVVNILSKCKDRIISVFHTMPSIGVKKNAFNVVLHNFIGRFSYRYIFVSKLAAQNVVNEFFVPKKKVECIYNFCDIGKITEQANEEIDNIEANRFLKEHDKIIINMGRLNKLKGQRNLIRAFCSVKRKFPQSGLIILGEGNERKYLEELVKKLGLNRDVYMPGAISNPFPYIKRADAFVLSSFYEGLPMSLIEAAACECPVISTDMLSGAREILAPDTDINYTTDNKEYAKYGILVPVCSDAPNDDNEFSRNEEILAEAIEDMLKNNGMCQKYIKRSNECAKSFSPEAIAKQWYKLIEDK